MISTAKYKHKAQKRGYCDHKVLSLELEKSSDPAVFQQLAFIPFLRSLITSMVLYPHSGRLKEADELLLEQIRQYPAQGLELGDSDKGESLLTG